MSRKYSEEESDLLYAIREDDVFSERVAVAAGTWMAGVIRATGKVPTLEEYTDWAFANAHLVKPTRP